MGAKIMKKTKSQAPLELFVTYWWALMVILLVIGALGYFGVLSPSGILPDRCSIDPNLECKYFKLAKTDSGTAVVRLKLTNNFPGQIIINSWDAISTKGVSLGCTNTPATGLWMNKETRDVEFAGCDNDIAGFAFDQKAKTKIVLNYRSALSDETFSKEIEFGVFATVTTVESLLGMPECNDDIDNDDNGCIDYDGSDSGCSSPSDTTESGGICQGGGGPPTEPLECFVTTACSDTVVFKMHALSDAHAEIPSLINYDYKACCRSATDTLSNSCTGPDTIPLHLSANTDAHAEKNTQSNFNVNACLSAAGGTVSCNYNANCLATETCLATMSADTDAHVADCVTQPYATKICCSLT